MAVSHILPFVFGTSGFVFAKPSLKSGIFSFAGKRLDGDYILEVPVQVNPIPQSVLDYAREQGVRIRDVEGRLYK